MENSKIPPECKLTPKQIQLAISAILTELNTYGATMPEHVKIQYHDLIDELKRLRGV